MICIIEKITGRLIPDWRNAWKWWSVQSAVVLGIWESINALLGYKIPETIGFAISAILICSVIIVRILAQPKLDKENGDGE